MTVRIKSNKRHVSAYCPRIMFNESDLDLEVFVSSKDGTTRKRLDLERAIELDLIEMRLNELIIKSGLVRVQAKVNPRILEQSGIYEVNQQAKEYEIYQNERSKRLLK